jgi:hypothetical protein
MRRGATPADGALANLSETSEAFLQAPPRTGPRRSTRTSGREAPAEAATRSPGRNARAARRPRPARHPARVGRVTAPRSADQRTASAQTMRPKTGHSALGTNWPGGGSISGFDGSSALRPCSGSQRSPARRPPGDLGSGQTGRPRRLSAGSRRDRGPDPTRSSPSCRGRPDCRCLDESTEGHA